MDDRLDMRFKASAADAAHRMAPWRPDIPWWAVGIQGVLALLLGSWLLVNQGAGEPVLGVMGIVLLAVASSWAWSAMRSDLPQVVLGWRGLRAGTGILAGALVVLDLSADFMPASAALVVLALGLLMVGGMGAAEWFSGRDRMSWRWPSLVGSAAAAVFGFIILVSRLQAAPVFLQAIAIALVAVGVLLLLRAGLLFRQEQVLRRAPAGGIAGSSAPTPVTQAAVGTVTPAVTVRSAGSARPGDPSGAPPSDAGSSTG